jgi:hypothetical protein
MANTASKRVAPKVVSKRKHVHLFTFKDEKEAHFFQIFLQNLPDAPIRETRNYVQGRPMSWNLVEVTFAESRGALARKECMVILNTLRETIDSSFPHFLSK